MISIYIILSIIFLHFMADFVFQSDAMAKGKSSSNYWLLYHISVYSVIMASFGLVFFNNKYFFLWVLSTFVLHFATDYWTSRLTTYLWKKGQVHNFFVVIGFDQCIHYCCLFGTYLWLTQWFLLPSKMRYISGSNVMTLLPRNWMISSSLEHLILCSIQNIRWVSGMGWSISFHYVPT